MSILAAIVRSFALPGRPEHPHDWVKQVEDDVIAQICLATALVALDHQDDVLAGSNLRVCQGVTQPGCEEHEVDIAQIDMTLQQFQVAILRSITMGLDTGEPWNSESDPW